MGIMQDEVDKLNAEAADLQNNARIEDQQIRQMDGEKHKERIQEIYSGIKVPGNIGEPVDQPIGHESGEEADEHRGEISVLRADVKSD